MENIAFDNGDCKIKENKIQCDIGQRLTESDMEVEIDMSGRVQKVSVENEDVELHSNTRGDVKVIGGSINDEHIDEDGKISRSFKNRPVFREGEQ